MIQKKVRLAVVPKSNKNQKETQTNNRIATYCIDYLLIPWVNLILWFSNIQVHKFLTPPVGFKPSPLKTSMVAA